MRCSLLPLQHPSSICSIATVGITGIKKYARDPSGRRAMTAQAAGGDTGQARPPAATAAVVPPQAHQPSLAQRLGQSFNSAGIALFARVALVRRGCRQGKVSWRGQHANAYPHPHPTPTLSPPPRPSCPPTHLPRWVALEWMKCQQSLPRGRHPALTARPTAGAAAPGGARRSLGGLGRAAGCWFPGRGV